MSRLTRVLIVIGVCLFLATLCFGEIDVEQITVLLNSSVVLPCRPASAVQGAVAVIVLWYRGNSAEPFYSYDIRKDIGGVCWSDDYVFGKRAEERAKCSAASLAVNAVRAEDENIYRCRVDFERGPSKAYSLKLNVIVLPSQPVITDENGGVVSLSAGPYHEGENVILTCRTIGGRPPPALLWFQNEEVLDDSFNGDDRGQVRNHLRLASLSRNQVDATYSCRAINNNITKPLDTRVAINITLAPLSITLRRLGGTETYVRAGILEELECKTVGSRPEPVVTWWRDGTKISEPNVTESVEPNITISVLRIRPQPKDFGVILTCRVENRALAGSVLEESFKLNVYYTPNVTLEMGLTLNPEEIREGSDVFMDCKVSANPKIRRINWIHQGQVIKHDVKKGIIISGNILVIQKVGREQTGSYQCQAVNSHGTGTSKSIYLSVMYAPLCSADMEEFYQVAKQGRVNVTCKIEAEPHNVTFRWQFNSSGGLVDLKNDVITTKGTTSVLSYSPETDGDYGLLLCSAENAIGVQHPPCVFNVTAAKPPEILVSCDIRNQSSDSVFVTCDHISTELPTAYTMEVRTSDSSTLVKTIRNNTPSFVASGLASGTAYTLHMGVKTPMGLSTPIKLPAFTLTAAEIKMHGDYSVEKTSKFFTITPIAAGSLIGIILTILIVLSIVIKICIQKRRLRRSPCVGKEGSPIIHISSPNISQKETLSTYSRPSPEIEENNDFISTPNECDYHLEELRVPMCHEVDHDKKVSGHRMTPRFTLSSQSYTNSHFIAPHKSNLPYHSGQNCGQDREHFHEFSSDVQGCLSFNESAGYSNSASFPPPEEFRGESHLCSELHAESVKDPAHQESSV